MTDSIIETIRLGTETQRVPVAPEWTGMARAVRTELVAEAEITGPVMRLLVEGALAEYERRERRVSKRLLDRLETRWRRLPTAACVHQSIERDKRRLNIIDVRATGSVALAEEWSEAEAGICLIANSLFATPQRMQWQAPLLCGLSLHAVARWHQRAFTNTRAQLMEELTRLAAAALVATAPEAVPGDWEVATGNGGFWRGSLGEVGRGGHRFLSIRSFY